MKGRYRRGLGMWHDKLWMPMSNPCCHSEGDEMNTTTIQTTTIMMTTTRMMILYPFIRVVIIIHCLRLRFELQNLNPNHQTINLYDFKDIDLQANDMYQNNYHHHHQPRHGGGIVLRCFTCWTDSVRVSRRTYWICLAVLLLVLIIVIPVGVTIRNNNSNNANAVPSAAAVTMTYRPTLPPHTFQNHDQSFTHGLVSSLLMHFGILNIHTFEKCQFTATTRCGILSWIDLIQNETQQQWIQSRLEIRTKSSKSC
jgi:hypothetical protein